MEAAFSVLFVSGTDYRFDYESGHRSGTTAIDYYDATHTLSAISGTPTVNASSAKFRGRPTLSCSGVVLQSNRATSAWPHLSNGAGGSLYAVVRRSGAGTGTHPIWSTRAPGVDPGSQFLGTAGNTTGTLYIADAVGSPVYFNNALPTTWITDAAAAYYFSYSEARTPKLRFRHNDTDIVGTSTLGTPSADAPSAPLTLARDCDMEVCAVFGFQRVLTATEEATIAAYSLMRWGVTL